MRSFSACDNHHTNSLNNLSCACPNSRPKLGIRKLVKELREIDVDGAPVLFHAASSRRKHSCFRIVYDLVDTVLGKGGLMEQVEAVDGLGRGILIHAARSNNLDTFRQVFSICKEAEEAASFITKDRSKKSSSQQHSMGSADANARVLRAVLVKHDSVGMNCLHHAAEAGGWEILKEVMKECQEVGGSFYREMDMPDKRGRTPVMFALRSNTEKDLPDTNLQKKFDMLYSAMPCGPTTAPGGRPGWMRPTSVPSYEPSSTTPDGVKTQAVTELMHAARGGVLSLELALNNILPNCKIEVNGGFTVDLDEALKVEGLGQNGLWVQTPATKVWGRAMLLAAAAKLGDPDVLYLVLNAIQVCRNISGHINLRLPTAVLGTRLTRTVYNDVEQRLYRMSLVPGTILFSKSKPVNLVSITAMVTLCVTTASWTLKLKGQLPFVGAATENNTKPFSVRVYCAVHVAPHRMGNSSFLEAMRETVSLVYPYRTINGGFRQEKNCRRW